LTAIAVPAHSLEARRLATLRGHDAPLTRLMDG